MKLIDELKRDRSEPFTSDNEYVKLCISKIKAENFKGKNSVVISDEDFPLEKLYFYFVSEGLGCTLSSNVTPLTKSVLKTDRTKFFRPDYVDEIIPGKYITTKQLELWW